ncbi:MAG TPA: hypothetical protein PKD39_11905 [Chitinophagales bacterium]|nr:hypothetical protein [Chitinophagales bacterium]
MKLRENLEIRFTFITSTKEYLLMTRIDKDKKTSVSKHDKTK